MHKPLVQGNLLVRQSIGLTSIDVQRGYDLVIACVSWERRSTAALTNTRGITGELALLRFASATPEIDKIKDEKEQTLKGISKNSSLVRLERATHFLENAAKIEEYLVDFRNRLKRPVKVLFDITCVPKVYSLFLFGLCFSRALVYRLDCVYAEGAYRLGEGNEPVPINIGATTARGIISEGMWTSQQVPYLEGFTAIPSQRDIIVALGGEVGLSLPFIEKYEPRVLALAMIKESVVQEPDKLIQSERAALLELLSEPNITRHDLALSDLLSLTKIATAFCRSSSAEAVTGIAIGSKPHALALGITALNEENMEVVCRIPAGYKPLNVEPNGCFSIYEIEDRFEPSAYF
jgi:hypothetical protein